MKFFVAFVLTALLSFAAALFFPWWSIAIAAFIVALIIDQRPPAAFLAAFLALFALWALQAFVIDVKNEHILSTRVAIILPLGGSYITVIIVTACIGGLVAGLSALTASFTRRNPRHRRPYS